MTHKLNSKEYF